MLQEEINILVEKVLQRASQHPISLTKRINNFLLKLTINNAALKTGIFCFVEAYPSFRSARTVVTAIQDFIVPSIRRLPFIGGMASNFLSFCLKYTPEKIIYVITHYCLAFTAKQFIAGEDLGTSIKAIQKLRNARQAFTIDVLGEYCVSEQEAETYVERYLSVIQTFKENRSLLSENIPLVKDHPCEKSALCISIKCSALYSQVSSLNHNRSVEKITERLTKILRAAKDTEALVFLDAEDSATNQVILDVYFKVYSLPEFLDYPYPGIVLQVYSKESEETLVRLLSFAKTRKAPIAIRLVKGAYWDHEQMAASQNNTPSPLFQYKQSTDAHYEKLTQICLDNIEHVLPAFASHNTRSLAHAVCYARAKGISPDRYELQMLYGMADHLAAAFEAEGILTRLYVPLGNLISGMGYFMRRLLENTSNESFLRVAFLEKNSNDLSIEIKKPAYHEQEQL